MCMHVYIYIHICMHACVYIYIYIHACMHTLYQLMKICIYNVYTHMYIHTCYTIHIRTVDCRRRPRPRRQARSSRRAQLHRRARCGRSSGCRSYVFMIRNVLLIIKNIRLRNTKVTRRIRNEQKKNKKTNKKEHEKQSCVKT